MSTDDAFLSKCGYPTGITGGADGAGISVHVDELTADEALEVSAMLERLGERLTPPSGQAFGVLEGMLQAINNVRGTDHHVESVAHEVCGVELGALTTADVHDMCRHVAGLLGR